MNNQWCILICQERWVLAARVSDHPQNAMKLLLDDCFTVRVWGTSKGIGELAIDGPTDIGTYDYEGSKIEQHEDFVMRIIPCTEKAAAKWTQRADSFTPTGKKKEEKTPHN